MSMRIFYALSSVRLDNYSNSIVKFVNKIT